MVKDKFVTYKIYRLIDSRYSPGDGNYVRYVGKTYRELEERLREHNSTCTSGILESGWFKAPTFGIQLVEFVNASVDITERESYWITLHERAGYNLLNCYLTHKADLPEDLGSPIVIREDIEARIENLILSDGYREFERESNERLHTIEQNIYALIETGQVGEDGARILLQAIGKG